MLIFVPTHYSFKVICHHTFCIVLFQQKYAYGVKQKQFQLFATKLSKNLHVLIAELGTSGLFDFPFLPILNEKILLTHR